VTRARPPTRGASILEASVLGVGAWLIACVTTPGSLAAQLAARAPRASAPPASVSPVRWPDVAFDPSSDVLLAVSGAGHVGGLLVASSGEPIGAPFVVDAASAFAQAPRVTHVDGVGFLVAWHESVGDRAELRGRLVRADGSFATGDLVLSPAGTNREMGAAIASSPESEVALAVWQSIPERQIVAQRLDVSEAALTTGGAAVRLGAPIVIDPRVRQFRDPAVAHHAVSDRFFVAYADCAADAACAVHVQRIDAGSGARVGEPILLEDRLDAAHVPELVSIAHTGRMLAVWYLRAGFAASFHARTIDADGALGELVTASLVGSDDANGLAYAPSSGTVVFVTHGSTTEDVAIELDAAGRPLGEPISFGVASATGNLNPRIAASTRAPRFLAVTSTELTSLTTQVLTTASRDPALDASVSLDGGVGPSDASDAGATADLDAALDRGPASGCACTVRPLASPPPWLALALVLVALGPRRNRSGRPAAG
jgi:hypothetical protein